MQLVYGKGVNTRSGVPNSVEKRYNFTVREPFSASFNCERENARSADESELQRAGAAKAG